MPGGAGPVSTRPAPAVPAASCSERIPQNPLQAPGEAPCASAPGSAVAASPGKYMETFFHSCWCFFLAAAWHNWSGERLFSVHYQLLEELFSFLYKAVHVWIIILSFDACFPQPLG